MASRQAGGFMRVKRYQTEKKKRTGKKGAFRGANELVVTVFCWFIVLSMCQFTAFAMIALPEPTTMNSTDIAETDQSGRAIQNAERILNNDVVLFEEDVKISDEGRIRETEYLENFGDEATQTGDLPKDQFEIRLYIDGEEILLTDPILNIGSRTYLPLRSFCEILGAEVTWRQEQNSVSIIRNRVEAIFTVDSDMYTVNGVARQMVDAFLYLDRAINRVYIPIRYEAETFGFEVVWLSDVDSQTVLISSTPVSEGELTNNEITIGGKIVWLGQSERQLIASLGYPNRIDESSYNMQWFIYNRDYREFIMVGLRDQRVCGFFSNCERLGLKGGINYGADKNEVESAGLSEGAMEFWFDPHDEGRLFAVFCVADAPSQAERQAIFDHKADLLLRAYEMECFDITNSFRVASGKPLVLYNIYAARVASAYAKEMAEKNFLDHISPEGNDPLDRFEAQGVYVKQVSENLAGGFDDAMHVIRGWVESASHRKGMLEENQYLGIGAYYRMASRYRYYFVQEFITLD